MSDFPSLVIRADGYAAQGAFAQAQAEYLDPDPDLVARLEQLLRSRNAGVVAHFYMDAELQGALYACDPTSTQIHISDSLVMADRAVAMAKAGADEVIVLGVDFMSENVRAILDESGHTEVGCWRVAEAKIGCSLAESAETPAYAAWLAKAAETPNSLHVVYINTSLRTKANAHHRVPTITCTSSNVVATVLQTFAQEPEAHVWFGPDTYMGQNLARLFRSLTELGPDGDASITALHPAHTRESIAALLPRFHYFEQGNCVVHHMFGAEVTTRVERDYYASGDVDVTAHLEVPSEMFSLALQAQREGRGVIGSTKNILDHIVGRVDAAIARATPGSERLRFVLGTEAGMVTAIVRAIRQRLADHHREGREHAVEVEIIFPVAAEAVATTRDPLLPIIPGVAGGEGCSTAGGCATCPFMKMNSIDALCDLLERLPDRSADLQDPEAIAAARRSLVGFEPEKYAELIAGQTVASLGTQPILHMREFQRERVLSPELLADMRGRAGSGLLR